jgi:hypothetical protein
LINFFALSKAKAVSQQFCLSACSCERKTEAREGLKELTLASLPIAIRRLDLLVDDCLIVELKALEKVLRLVTDSQC